MKNITQSLPTEYTASDVLTACFEHKGVRYVWVSENFSGDFSQVFGHDAKRLSAMLLGSSWGSAAYIFYTADCFDPPVYVQFGSSFEDAHESFLDNEPSLVISPEEMKDYDMDSHSSFNSDGEPVDTDNVQGFGPVKLVSVTFAI